MTQTDTFETFDKAQLAEIAPKIEKTPPDPVWTARIQPLTVGTGFRVHRIEGETVRQLKKRINKAAGVSFKTLEWLPEQKNVAADDVTSFIVKIRALDLKAKAEAEKKAEEEKSQNGSNPSPTAPEPTSENEPAVSPEITPETPSGPRRPR